MSLEQEYDRHFREKVDSLVTKRQDLGKGYQLELEQPVANTVSDFSIVYLGTKVGSVKLNFNYKTPDIFFDIEIDQAARHKGHAQRVLEALARVYGSLDFTLITGGVQKESCPFWEHMVEVSVAERVEYQGSTQYKLVNSSKSAA